MFIIVPAPKQNRLKPHRGGMKLPGAAHAAPTGLKRIARRGVAINMSPRWGLVQTGQCTRRPNKRAVVNEHRPIHVHVRYGGGEAIFEVEQAVELRESQGLKVRELAKAQALATEHQGLIIDKWHERFNR